MTGARLSASGLHPMKFLTDPIAKSSAEIRALANRLVDESRSVVRSSLGMLPLLSNREITTPDDLDQDETHYFLVPYHLSNEGYLLYTTRLIPDGYSTENDLPKRRFFHVPGSGSERVLEKLWIEERRKEQTPNNQEDQTLSLGDRLNQLGDEIDRKSDLVSCGLVVIAGVVAVSNPLLGVGIAAKSLLPSLGARLSSESLRHVGEKLKRRQTDQAEKESAKEATNALRSVRAEVIVNPLLQALEKALVTDAAQYDPLVDFDESSFVTICPTRGMGYYQMTAGAIDRVYREIEPREFSKANLGPEDLRWLDTLKAFQRNTDD